MFGVVSFIEILMVLYFVVVMGLVVVLQLWICLFVLVLFFGGYGWVVWMFVVEFVGWFLFLVVVYGFC